MNMTRIISGLAGSLRLDVPKSGTRPTSDRVREAIFSSLTAWGMTDGVRVLDLFAGSGALGLEAASRGASEVVLVEKHPPAAQIVQLNVDRVRQALSTEHNPVLTVHRKTALSFVTDADANTSWDVIFVDPPYDFAHAALGEQLTLIAPHLSADGLIMVERSTRDGAPALPPALSIFKEKKYGETTLWWVERSDRVIPSGE